MSEPTYPKVGTAVPSFKLASSTGETVESSALKGKPFVLFFYPKADTPGCTKEACGFRDAIAGYKKLSMTVFGISPDPVKDEIAFAKKFDLNFPLLADEDHAVCEKFGVWQEKSMYGKKYMGAARTTFVIDKAGNIAHVFEKVKPEGHDQEVLTWVTENLK
ncbi:thioredoxin-dependent thiol peroxidase [soil metagenome]